MKSLTSLKRAALVTLTLGYIASMAANAHAALQFWRTDGTAGTWTGTNWSAAPSATGGTAWATNNTAQFTANTGALTFASTNVTGVTVDAGVIAAITTTGGTWSTNGTVMPVTVGAGGVFDMASQGTSTAAGVGFSKSGSGTLSIIGSAYLGGFTLNDGIVVLRGINAMGNGAVTINGGTIAVNANRAITGVTGITVGGNFTMGAVTSNVPSGNATATNTFSITAPMNLGGSPRTITIGGNANGYTFSGLVSNGSLVIDAASGATGRIILLSPSSTYSGGTTIKTGATLSTNAISSNGGFTAGPLGIGTLTLDGGNYIPSSGGSNTIANAIALNNVSGNSITNSTTSGTGTILSGNITGLGGFTKNGSGVLILSGANNYAGQTIVSGGTLALAKTQSFYNGAPASWTDTNFNVQSGAALVYAVGGSGEFTFSQFLQQATVGTGSGGFKDGSSIGIDTTNGGDQTIATVFTDNNSSANKLGLLKSGTGTLFLTAANTHRGPTTAAGGTLNLSNLLAVQNSTLTTTTVAGSAVVFDQTAGGTAFTAGGLAGAGGLALQNSNGDPVQLTVGGNNVDADFTGGLSGGSSSSLTKVGTGLQTLGGSNGSFTGSVFLNGGTLGINSTTAFGTGATLTIAGGTKIDNTSGVSKSLSTTYTQNWNGNFTWGGTNALNMGPGAVTMAGNIEIAATGVDSQSNTLTIAGAISGSGFNITKSGPGRVNLSGQNTFSGGVTVTAGSVHASETSSNLGSGYGPLGTGTLTLNGGRLIMSSNAGTINNIENAITLTGTATSNTVTSQGKGTLSGIITGTGGFSASSAGTVILSNANTFGGDTIAASGTLNLSHQLALQNSTLVTSSTGGFIAFDSTVAGNAFTLGGLSGDRNLALANTASTAIELTVGNNNSDTTHTGILSNGGSIVKVGTGKTTLGGANTYTGTTTVNGGTLLVTGGHSGGAAYTVNTGGTLGGIGTITADVLVNSGGKIAPGASVGNLTVGSADIDGTFAVEYNGDTNTIDLLTVTNALDVTNTIADFDNLGTAALSGSSYVFATYGSLVGATFANVLDLPAGYTIDYNYQSLKQIALVAASGDYNGDTKVNAADFVTWRKDPTNPGFGGDPGGYQTWRQNFGNPPSSSLGLAFVAVPEPATLALLTCLALTGACRRGRRAGGANRWTP